MIILTPIMHVSKKWFNPIRARSRQRAANRAPADRNGLLSNWHQPAGQMARKTVALFMAMAFLLPAVIWAFDLDNYFTPQVLEIRLGNPGSLKLSQDFSVPGSLGKVLAAHQGTGSMTFILCTNNMLGGIKASIIPVIKTAGLQVFSKTPDMLMSVGEGVVVLGGLLFGPLGVAAATGVALLRSRSRSRADSTEKALGTDFFGYRAKKRRNKDRLANGKQYPENPEYNPPAAFELVDSNKVVDKAMDIIEALGLREEAADDDQHNRRIPFVDWYHQAHIAISAPHVDGSMVCGQLVDEAINDNEIQIMLRVLVTDLQYFGGEDFRPEDFDANDLKVRLGAELDPAAKKPARTLERELLDKLRIKTLQQLEGMDNNTLAKQFANMVNFYLEQTILFDYMDYNMLTQYPEVAEIVRRGKAVLAEGKKIRTHELRQINRAIIEVVFPRQERPSRPTRIPDEFLRGYLNVYNPLVHLVCLGKMLGLVMTPKEVQRTDGLLDALGDKRKAYENVLLANAAKWGKLIPWDVVAGNKVAAEDLQMVEDLGLAIFMHEFKHLTSLHTPHKKLSNMTDEEWSRQEKYSVNALQRFYQGKQEILQSGLYNKNLIKALKAVKDSKEDSETVKQIIAAIRTLENNCDRGGSMFYLISYWNLQAYQEVIDAINAREPGRFKGVRPATVMQMLDLERDMREGRTSFEKIGFTAEDVQALQKKKQANSKRHPFVRLGNPELFPEEMEMYEEQYRLEHHFFTEGKLGIVSTEHVEGHPFISVSTSLSPYEINDARSDFVPAVVELVERGVHPLAAFSKVAGEQLFGEQPNVPVYAIDEER